MSDMTNEQIVAEFENLFGGSNEPDEEDAPETPEDTSEDEQNPEETDESEEAAEDESSDESDSQEQTQASKDNKQSKQNHAFAEQRLQIKKQNEFIKKVGKLVGFDDSTNPDDILAKVNEALLAKQSKEQNIPVDVLKRIEASESALQELDRIKLEKKVTEDFTDLIEEHKLSKEEVDEFTQYLIENGKNPMVEASVDLKAEYLKLHYNDLVQKAVQAALAKEEKRKKKVDEKSPSGVDKAPSTNDDAKVSSVKELDDLFANMDL